MTKSASQELLRKVRKLAQLPDEARQCQHAISVTRLTILKSLCQEPEVANRFVTYLAQRTRQKVEEKKKRPGGLSTEEWVRHRELIRQAIAALENYLDQPSKEERERLRMLYHGLASEQNEHRRVYGGQVRIIKDSDLLLVEYALRTVVADEPSVRLWAYQTARHYAERYDPSHGNGLIPVSAPLVQDIADFWMQELNLVTEQLTSRMPKKEKLPARSSQQQVRFTHRQGQFLAFIHLYHKLHRQGPAELDMVQYFRVTPAAVHGMVVKLDELGQITRVSGVSRSVRVAIPDGEIPALDEVEGPSW